MGLEGSSPPSPPPPPAPPLCPSLITERGTTILENQRECQSKSKRTSTRNDIALLQNEPKKTLLEKKGFFILTRDSSELHLLHCFLQVSLENAICKVSASSQQTLITFGVFSVHLEQLPLSLSPGNMSIAPSRTKRKWLSAAEKTFISGPLLRNGARLALAQPASN